MKTSGFWENARFFDQIWAWQQGGFLYYIENRTWKHRVFERMGVFLTKYGHESVVFFREWTLFWQYMGMRADIFREKSEKKDILLTFLTHNNNKV